MKRDRSRLAKIIRKFRGCRIGVLGDFMLDESLRGEATRISPEAPVPVVLITNPDRAEGFFPGGAGNVAANIASLGGRAVAFGALGADESGRMLAELLKGRGIATATLAKEGGRITPRKVRIAAHQQQLLRLDFERTTPITDRTTRSLIRNFTRWAGRLRALVISDYQKGTVTSTLCREILSLARQRRLPVFVDPKPEHPEICRGATVVTPNLREAEVMAGVSMRDRRQLEVGGRRLLAELGCENLLITRGGEGMTLFGSDGLVHEFSSVPRPVYDVTGAGDTVIAVLALAYGAGATLKEAAELANAAGGRVVLEFGTSEISPQELLDALREHPGNS